MQIMRREGWNPFREFDELSDRFNRVFGLGRPSSDGRQVTALSDWAPACDITETKDGYRVTAELPNVKKEDIAITVDRGVLAIKGERREEKEEKDVKFHRREMSYGSFLRSFTLPDDADAAKVEAKFADGVLTVNVAKTPGKKNESRQIAVQ